MNKLTFRWLSIKDLTSYSLFTKAVTDHLAKNGHQRFVALLSYEQRVNALLNSHIGGLWLGDDLAAATTFEHGDLASRILDRFDSEDLAGLNSDGYYLRNVMTHPSHQRSGLMPLLLNTVAAETGDKMHKTMALTSNIDNVPAHKVACAAGFSVTGKAKRKSDGSDMLIFTRVPNTLKEVVAA